MSDVPTTPVYGLPHERGVTLPGRTLTGGPTGEDPILAEAVEAELQRVDGDVEDLRAAVARGWQPITHGEMSDEPSFVVDVTDGGRVPAGTFSRVRLTMTGRTGGAVAITARINGDSSSGLHQSSWLALDAADAGSVYDSGGGSTGSTVRLGMWSTSTRGNVIEATWELTDVASRCPYRSESRRQATGAGNFAVHSSAWGGLEEDRLLSSIHVRTAGLEFDLRDVRWWLEGWRP